MSLGPEGSECAAWPALAQGPRHPGSGRVRAAGSGLPPTLGCSSGSGPQQLPRGSSGQPVGRHGHPPGPASAPTAFSCPASPASSTSSPTGGDRVLAHSSGPVHTGRPSCPLLGKAAGTYRGHPVLALVGDKVGVEAPAQGGLLDVVRQDFRRLVWAGEKTEEDKGAPWHEDISEQSDHFQGTFARSSQPPVSQVTHVRSGRGTAQAWPLWQP